MKRISAVFLLAMFFAAPVFADDAKKDEPSKEPSAVEVLKENPNDTKALNAYMLENLRGLSTLLTSDPDAAQKRLTMMAKFLGSLEPDDADAKTLHGRATRAVDFYKQRLEIARLSLEDVKEKLEANPDDTSSLTNFFSKVSMEVGPIARSDSDKADEKLTAAKKFIESVAEKAQEESTKKLIESNLRSFASLERSIEAGKKLAALIGAEAAPLEVEAWANGSPLSEGDLKGKVVLLDFWAVWCGPCVATFPHLREWQEKYADKGLVIIGLTRFYNYTWDEEAGRAKKSKEEVNPEDELKTLEKFAESHNLHHRFAIQKGRGLSDYYAVSGIPHVVLIDQEGKVRLMRVGSGAQNAQDVEEMLDKLLADSGK